MVKILIRRLMRDCEVDEHFFYEDTDIPSKKIYDALYIDSVFSEWMLNHFLSRIGIKQYDLIKYMHLNPKHQEFMYQRILVEMRRRVKAWREVVYQRGREKRFQERLAAKQKNSEV